MDSAVGYYKNSIGIASKSQARIGFTDLGIIITLTTVDTSEIFIWIKVIINNLKEK